MKGMLYYRHTNGYVHGYLVLKKLRCGHRKILRLTTPLTIYRVGLRGNSAHKSTRKHRFWTKKHLKCPEITQKITPNLFGTQRSWVRIPSSRPKNAGNCLNFLHFFISYYLLQSFQIGNIYFLQRYPNFPKYEHV